LEPAFVNRHFIPVALDTYFRGNSHELAYCKKIRAGGNHLVAATASGTVLASGRALRLHSQALKPVLAEFKKQPLAARRGKPEDAAKATPPRRPVPKAPAGGLVIRGFCTYMQKDAKSQWARTKRFYYEQNPNRWAAETQSDMLWLTAAEARSLVPATPQVGVRVPVAVAIRERFFSTIGIDYMEGSVNSLKLRATEMTLTVTTVTDNGIAMKLEGYGWMGRELDLKLRIQPRSRGCELRVLGRLHFDRRKKAFDRFDVVGLGEAWGNKMNYIRREVIPRGYPWQYGIACELVTGDSPMDRIPPYNLLHYGSAGPYFGKK